MDITGGLKIMETVESVAQWAEETFGDTTPILALGRAMEEITELRHAWNRYPDCTEEEMVKEAADVCITLYRYIYLIDKEAIDKKMVINRKRQWIRDGSGNGQHCEERESNP